MLHTKYMLICIIIGRELSHAKCHFVGHISLTYEPELLTRKQRTDE